MPSLSDILSAKIGSNGKSKAYIANELGVGEKTIENYMRGLRSPKPDVLVKLSRILKFNLSELSEQNVPRENSATTATETAQISTISKNKDTDTRKNKLTTTTAKIDYGMRPTNGTNEHEAVIKDHIKAINTIADTSNSQQETISKLTDLVTKLIKK